LLTVISDTESLYLYGLDIIAQQQYERLYYAHDGLGSVRQLVDTTGNIETNYAYDPFGVPVVAGDVSNPYQFTGEAWDGELIGMFVTLASYGLDTGLEIGQLVMVGPHAVSGLLSRSTDYYRECGYRR
jgi:hypothetical protein